MSAGELDVARAVLTILVVLAASACTADPPEVPGGLAEFDAGIPFADTIVSYGPAGDQQTCTDVLPACDAEPADCGPTAVLGGPDAEAYLLPAGGVITVGFRCSQITENGSNDGTDISPDFQIFATVADGAQAVVEVSFDGTSYVSLNTLTQTDQSFDLSREDLSVIRFVRVADTGGGGISIDAFAAL